MSEETDAGWFDGLNPGDLDAARASIERGGTESPGAWPDLAVKAGFAADESGYYDRLHEATVDATRRAAREAGRADDRQVIHAVRAMDDTPRVA